MVDVGNEKIGTSTWVLRLFAHPTGCDRYRHMDAYYRQKTCSFPASFIMKYKIHRASLFMERCRFAAGDAVYDADMVDSFNFESQDT